MHRQARPRGLKRLFVVSGLQGQICCSAAVKLTDATFAPCCPAGAWWRRSDQRLRRSNSESHGLQRLGLVRTGSTTGMCVVAGTKTCSRLCVDSDTVWIRAVGAMVDNPLAPVRYCPGKVVTLATVCSLQVHGHNLSCIAPLPLEDSNVITGLRYVSGSEEKVSSCGDPAFSPLHLFHDMLMIETGNRPLLASLQILRVFQAPAAFASSIQLARGQQVHGLLPPSMSLSRDFPSVRRLLVITAMLGSRPGTLLAGAGHSWRPLVAHPLLGTCFKDAWGRRCDTPDPGLCCVSGQRS